MKGGLHILLLLYHHRKETPSVRDSIFHITPSLQTISNMLTEAIRATIMQPGLKSEPSNSKSVKMHKTTAKSESGWELQHRVPKGPSGNPAAATFKTCTLQSVLLSNGNCYIHYFSVQFDRRSARFPRQVKKAPRKLDEYSAQEMRWQQHYWLLARSSAFLRI